MKDKLPPNVLRRPKIGFDIPVHDWLRGVLRPLLLDTISEEAVRASGLFHWNARGKNCSATTWSGGQTWGITYGD